MPRINSGCFALCPSLCKVCSLMSVYIKRWCCLTSVWLTMWRPTSVWRLTSVAYIQSAGGVCGRPAGRRVLADRARLGRPGSRLPMRASVAGLGGGISWRPPVHSLFTFILCVGLCGEWTCYCYYYYYFFFYTLGRYIPEGLTEKVIIIIIILFYFILFYPWC